MSEDVTHEDVIVGQRQGKMQKALGCAIVQKVHCDLTGPHPTFKYSFKYLLTVICSFSKYLIAVPIRDKTSLTVALGPLLNC